MHLRKTYFTTILYLLIIPLRSFEKNGLLFSKGFLDNLMAQSAQNCKLLKNEDCSLSLN